MKKEKKIIVQDIVVTFISKDGSDYLSLTDMAKSKNAEFPADVVKNWLKTRFTIDFMGIWEQMHNPNFNMVEFDQFKNKLFLNTSNSMDFNYGEFAIIKSQAGWKRINKEIKINEVSLSQNVTN